MKTITQITSQLKKEFIEALGFEPDVKLFETKLIVSFESTVYEKSYSANEFLRNAQNNGFIKSVANYVTLNLLEGK